MPLKILVFPCGSEVGLEIFRSLRYSRHFRLMGASSVEDHGAYVYKDYIGNLPFAEDSAFIGEVARTVRAFGIDAIYPSMDRVIAILKREEPRLGCKVIGPSVETAEICLSKRRTYDTLAGIVPTPLVYKTLEQVAEYPVFIKPVVGYGTRGTKKADSYEQAVQHLKDFPESLILELLPGEEYTVDCYTKKTGELLFASPRSRSRVSHGISVSTRTVRAVSEECLEIARKINDAIRFEGAWFFQLKRNTNGQLVLLEVAARIGGSSGLHRYLGVNFALLSVFEAFGHDVSLLTNSFDMEMDRALDCRCKISVEYNTVYVDLDDTLVIGDSLNYDLVKYLYQCVGKGKRVVLITKHASDASETLANYRVASLFDEIITIPIDKEKSDFMDAYNSIFIDDSFAERKTVHERLGMPVFAPDMIESLMDY